jgi:hypothetical protein
MAFLSMSIIMWSISSSDMVRWPGSVDLTGRTSDGSARLSSGNDQSP